MSATPSPAEILTQILEPLRAMIAAHASKHWASIPLIVLLHGYLGRLSRRFASVTRRPAENRPVAPRTPRPRSPSTQPGKPRLPQTFAWLSHLAPETNVFGSQLRHLLASPQMRELLEASPQACKLLRPLCRMLAIGPGPDPNIPPALFRPPPKAAPPVAPPVATGPADPPAAEPATPPILRPPWPLAPA